MGYINGEIKQLPWTDSDKLQGESTELVNQLIEMNNKGFLTINSQPRVNGLPSTDAKVGWGPESGFVYQKAYLEFFCPPKALDGLLAAVKADSSISYQVVNTKGAYQSNIAEDAVLAATWGVFPGKEIVQPPLWTPPPSRSGRMRPSLSG